MNIKNKIVLLTGASTGIGKGIAKAFLEKKAKVIVFGLHKPEFCSVFYKVDVSEEQQIVFALSRIEKIDILINNAGINIGMNERRPIHEFPNDMWKKILNVDLDGVYYCSRAALQNMTKNGYGKIINISSIVGVVPLRNQCAFAAAKAGVIHLTKAMAIELAPFGINVNVICPGSIQIPIMIESGMYADNRFESIMSHIPMKRPGTPQDIGYAALYLASDQASYVTGAVHVGDGGWTTGFARDW